MWASFDTAIFSRGKFLAPIPPEWRPFAPALQPQWALETPGHAFWSSTYLPMNAAFRALFARLGSPALAGPFWAGLSVVLIYRIARTLWPERRDAALVAALLLASSSQLLLTAMSPYAMTPHLALNLAWLWLFLQRPRWTQICAVVVAFAATGLHQLIFHPLFAAPFVLQLWVNRRWGLASFHTLAYLAIGLFWVSYWSLMLGAFGIGADGGVMASSNFAARVIELISKSPISGVGTMAEYLLRFIAWQNPLAIVLALTVAPLAVRRWREPLGGLLAGMVLTILAVGILLSYQGHGWGYRYLHGFLGSLCLLAAFGWIGITRAGDPRAGGAWAGLAVMTAFALLVALPMRLVQADLLISPPFRAFQAVRGADADVVLVDTRGMVFGVDLIRNDPFLTNRPKMMDLSVLSAPQVRDLCRRYRVATFDLSDAPYLSAEDVPPDELRPSPGVLELARIPDCGRHVTQPRRRSRPANGSGAN